jgi:nicotinamidase-related amidase
VALFSYSSFVKNRICLTRSSRGGSIGDSSVVDLLTGVMVVVVVGIISVYCFVSSLRSVLAQSRVTLDRAAVRSGNSDFSHHRKNGCRVSNRDSRWFGSCRTERD